MTRNQRRPEQEKEIILMKITLRNRTALMALLFALVLPLVPKVYASGHFATSYTNESLTGVCGYSTAAENLGPANPNNNGTNIPVNNAGVMWFDGNGPFEFNNTAKEGGLLFR